MAVGAFETLTGLRVTIHNHTWNLSQLVPPERFGHDHPLCRSVKAQREAECMSVDLRHCMEIATAYPKGFTKRCHAGITEVVVPWIEDGQVCWMLFAGPFRTHGGGATLTTPVLPGSWHGRIQTLPILSEEQSLVVLESLRQLASRLSDIFGETADLTHHQTAPRSQSRADAIHAFILSNYKSDIKSADLAPILGVSPARVGHAVQEACNKSFRDILKEVRLRNAADLLRHTNFTVEAVARSCGIPELTNFHRQFIKRFGESPAVYRKNHIA